MRAIFESDDKFDGNSRVQRVELVAEQFVDEQVLAALGRIVQTGGGKLVATGNNGMQAKVLFGAARR